MDLFVAGPKGTLLRPSNTNDITVFWDQVARHGLGLGERTQRSSLLGCLTRLTERPTAHSQPPTKDFQGGVGCGAGSVLWICDKNDDLVPLGGSSHLVSRYIPSYFCGISRVDPLK